MANFRTTEPKQPSKDDMLWELRSDDVTKKQIEMLQKIQKDKLEQFKKNLDEAFNSSVNYLYDTFITDEKERQKKEAEEIMRAAKEAEEKKKLEEDKQKLKDKEADIEAMLRIFNSQVKKQKTEDVAMV